MKRQIYRLYQWDHGVDRWVGMKLFAAPVIFVAIFVLAYYISRG